MRFRGEKIFDEIFVVGFRTDKPLPASLLRAVKVKRRALNEAFVRNGNHATFVRNNVFRTEFAFRRTDFRFARGRIFFAHRSQFRFHEFEQLLFVGKNFATFVDVAHELDVFRFNLVDFQARELIQAHIENRFDLNFGQPVFRHELLRRFVSILRGTDNVDEIVEVAICDFETFKNMRAGFGLAQTETRAARDDVAAVLDEAFEHFADVHLLRARVVEREQNRAERRFERRMLVKFVHHNALGFAALELNHDARVRVGFVAQVTHFRKHFFVHEFRNTLHERFAVHVIRDFRDNDLFKTVFDFFDVCDPANFHDPAPGAKILLNAVGPADATAGREVRSFNDFFDFIERKHRIIDEAAAHFDELAEIVRRNIRRHADGDPG